MKEMKKSAAWLRRGLLAALLMTAAALGAARCWPQEPTLVEPSPTPSIQPTQRAVRENAYEKDLAALRTLAEEETNDPETRAQAAALLTRLVEEHQTELGLEEALQAAGYQPELVLMQNGALTILLNDEASAEVSASILALCAAHAEVAVENVRIMGK